MSAATPLRLHIGPRPDAGIVAAVSDLPVVLVEQPDAEAVIWLGSDPRELQDSLRPSNRWVQLRSAGIERFVDAGVIDDARVWTSAAGAYAQPVSEHAIALLLAGVRGVGRLARRRSWEREAGFDLVGSLGGSTVAVVGAGGIGRAIIARLRAFEVQIVAVNRSGTPVEGAARTVAVDDLPSVIDSIDHLVLALPDTAQSRGLVGTELLDRLGPSSWIVNVGRGGAIDEAALLERLRAGSLGGAALDVTAQEPLPDGHPFWEMDNVIITPHVANTPAALETMLIQRIRQNIARYLAGDPLLGVVDVANGY